MRQIQLKRLAAFVNEGVKDRRPLVTLEHVESWTGKIIEGIELGSVNAADTGVQAVEPGDVLFGKLRPYLAKSIAAESPLAASSEFVCMRPFPDIDPHWLGYVTRSSAFVEWAVATSEGTKMPRTSWEKLRDYTLVVPSLAVQDAIACYLDTETARIDALITKKRRMAELAKERWSATLDRLISGGADTAKLIDRAIDATIPLGWEMRKLSHLLDPRIPLVYGILLPGPRLDEGVAYIGSGDVRSDRLRLEHLPRTTEVIAAQYPRSRMRAGELVYAIRGSFGAVEQIPSQLDGVNLSRDAARIAPAREVHSRWLMFALKSHVAQEQFSRHEVGAMVTGVNIGDLKNIRLPVPPPKVQAELAEQLDALSQHFSSGLVEVA